MSEGLETLEPVLPPEGVVAARLRDVAGRALSRRRVDVAGAQGCAPAAVAAAIARAGDRPGVVGTGDVDEARRAAQDAAFLLRVKEDEETAEDTGQGEVLVFAASESSPYADVNPDRRAAMSRMATLQHLASGKPWRVL